MKSEVYRVAERHGLKVLVVSNSPIAVPRDPLVERVVVGDAMDAADDWIAARAGPGDIVITADVPLASRGVKAGAAVIAPNGKVFDQELIGMALATRNLLHELRVPAKSPAVRNRSRREIAHSSCRRLISRWSG